MKPRSLMRPLRTLALTVFTGALVGSIAFAQRPGPPPGGPPGPHPATAASVPVSVLKAGLNLSEDQMAKVTDIQKNLRKEIHAILPPPEEMTGEPPDPETMHAKMDKIRDLDKQASSDIKDLLNDDQKKSLTTLMKMLNDLQMVGIPAPVYNELKLTSDQKAQLADIAKGVRVAMRKAVDSNQDSMDFAEVRDMMRDAHMQAAKKASDVLTDTQKAIVAKFKRNHPRDPGGPGGPPPGEGGQRGHRRGGPPPPDGEGGGPPPPGDDGFGPDGGGPPPDGPRRGGSARRQRGGQGHPQPNGGGGRPDPGDGGPPPSQDSALPPGYSSDPGEQ